MIGQNRSDLGGRHFPFGDHDAPLDHGDQQAPQRRAALRPEPHRPHVGRCGRANHGEHGGLPPVGMHVGLRKPAASERVGLRLGYVIHYSPSGDEPNKIISYKQFVDDSHPYQSLKFAPDSDIDHIKAVNKAAKKKRTALQSAFTGGEDAPGRRVRASFDEVMQKLHFPEGEQREAAKQLAATMPQSRLQEAWSDGKYYLLPSFLHFLAYLASPQVTQKEVDVKLVFRTFGDDIVEVARELDFLVEGKHPVGLPPLPEHFRLNLEPSASRVGTFYRDGFEADGTALAVGTLTKVPFSSKLAEEGADAPNNFYAASNLDVKVIRGFQPIQQTLEGMLEGASTLALRDYWEWWSAHAEDGQYGKLLLVNEEDDDNISVFFDDHIEAHHSHIVDVRDIRSGAPVDFEKSRGKYLQRVEPFAAITDANYFTSLFEEYVK